METLLAAKLLAFWQVYGQNRESSTAKGRWLARGVDLLLHQYPGLRVAFIHRWAGAPSGWGEAAQACLMRFLNRGD